MKKILCAVLICVLAFSFTACKSEKDKSKENGVDIEYYAELGSMPECKYNLGENIDTLNSELEEIYNTVEESVYNVSEGEKTVKIDSGTFQYYYVKENKNDGVSYIVNFDKAYEFKIGTVSVEITEALSDFKYTEEAFNDDNAFFVLGNAGGKVLKYSFGKNTVAFLFVDDALFATAIYRTSDWE